MKQYITISHFTIIIIGFLLMACGNGGNMMEEVINIDFEVKDDNRNQLFEVAEELVFIPNGVDIKEHQFKWEFGIAAQPSTHARSRFTYEEGGRYLVTLTVDNVHKAEKVIRVVDRTPPTVYDTLVTIESANMAFVGEEVLFRAHGTGISEWFWKFGEIDGFVDNNRMAQVAHIYSRPGIYRVEVTTNLSKYPVYHVIEILPPFEANVEEDAVDSLAVVANKIQKYLQLIANSPVTDLQTISEYRSKIAENYLIEDVSKVVVVINGERYNDFYSYCQGIHHLDSDENMELTIDEVKVDTVKGIQRLEVYQSSANTLP